LLESKHALARWFAELLVLFDAKVLCFGQPRWLGTVQGTTRGVQRLKAAFGLGWSQRTVKRFLPQLQRVSLARHHHAWERDLPTSVSDQGQTLPAGLSPVPARAVTHREMEAEPTYIA